jgi:receptor protein-tyrosine kinase
LLPLNGQGGDTVAQVDAYAGAYWESYRGVRTSLLFSPESRPKSILLTSAVAGEGKTTTAINLAIALAQTGARTVIVELDMRRPRLAEKFGLPERCGMSRYLSGQSALHTEIRPTGVPNLCVVGGGPIPPNAAELLGSPRMRRALELLGRHFEYVIVDGPPLNIVTDASVISPQVDGVLLVVRATTATATVQKARNLLRNVDAKILGAVITSAAVDASQHYYPAIDAGTTRTMRAAQRIELN